MSPFFRQALLRICPYVILIRQDRGYIERIFNEQFDVYATNAHSAFYVVTPIVMERLLSMKAKYGSFGLAVSGDKIMISGRYGQRERRAMVIVIALLRML